MKIALILSGGMDSSVLFWKLLSKNQVNEIHCLTFDYGQRHKKEIDSAVLVVKAARIFIGKKGYPINVYHSVIPIARFNEIAVGSSQTDKSVEVPEGHYEEENMKKTVVPNRNMVMLSIAASYCFARKLSILFYGAHAGDHAIYPDCRPSFVEAMNETFKLADWEELKLAAPFIEYDKGDIAKLGVELGTPFNLTWTCYKGLERPCGKCGACQERAEAFKKAGAIDPLVFKA